VTEEKIFRYELMWESHEKFKPHLDDVWKEDGKAVSMAQLQKKFARLSESLGHWEKHTFGHVKREIQQLNERLAQLRADPGRQSPSYEEINVVKRLVELYEREEVMWRQRSRVQWLAKGDKNTRFFHLRANQRKKRNNIKSLRRPGGVLTEDV
jgi:DNA repair exonuclease SbcCD ATPase subunit